MTAGAPPDEFNQLGQDWSQPPWRPDRLAEQEYRPFRALIQAALRHAGAVRIDHIIGLFRLWWIPDGAPPTQGTYVRYDHDAMIGIVALEAHRPGRLSSVRISAPSSRGYATIYYCGACWAPQFSGLSRIEIAGRLEHHCRPNAGGSTACRR